MIMGGSEGKRSKNFKRFEAICCDLFNVCRKNANLFINMMSLVRATPLSASSTKRSSELLLARADVSAAAGGAADPGRPRVYGAGVCAGPDRRRGGRGPTQTPNVLRVDSSNVSDRRRGVRLHAQTFKALITKSLGTMMTKINWTAHIIAHS